MGIREVFFYFAILSVGFHDMFSLFGFFIFLCIVFQLISGIMLAFSLIPEPMLIPIIREEEDMEDLYIEDFFWLHERGVDLLFLFLYIHCFRKLFLNVFNSGAAAAWKSGVFAFLIFQIVVFCGLILCCTHLSEITLTIAANIVNTFFFFKGQLYWWFFTNKQLNTDTIIRLIYLHYLAAFYIAYLGLVHGIDMHYDWKTDNSFDGLTALLVWWDEALNSECSYLLDGLVFSCLTCFLLYTEPEAISYELFMWGDIGLVVDVRYYSVAPHWYFRPFMSWLIVCPHHKTGIFGLIFFFFVLFFQPNLHGRPLQYQVNIKNIHSLIPISTDLNLIYCSLFALFLGSCVYVSSFLPYGRFFNHLGGNNGMLFGYIYLLSYLGFPWFRHFKSSTKRFMRLFAIIV